LRWAPCRPRVHGGRHGGPTPRRSAACERHDRGRRVALSPHRRTTRPRPAPPGRAGRPIRPCRPTGTRRHGSPGRAAHGSERRGNSGRVALLPPPRATRLSKPRDPQGPHNEPGAAPSPPGGRHGGLEAPAGKRAVGLGAVPPHGDKAARRSRATRGKAEGRVRSRAAPRDGTARRYAGHPPATTGRPVRAAPPHGGKAARRSQAGPYKRTAQPVRGRAAPRGKTARRSRAGPSTRTARPVRAAPPHGGKTARLSRAGRPKGRHGGPVRRSGAPAHEVGGAADRTPRGFGGRAALTGVGRHGPSSAHAGSTNRRGKIGSRTRSEDRPAVMESRCPLWTKKTMRSTVDSAGRCRAAPRGGTAPIVAASNRRLTT
jgi:hypothetical protein